MNSEKFVRCTHNIKWLYLEAKGLRFEQRW
jgi:hypothetical protein